MQQFRFTIRKRTFVQTDPTFLTQGKLANGRRHEADANGKRPTLTVRSDKSSYAPGEVLLHYAVDMYQTRTCRLNGDRSVIYDVACPSDGNCHPGRHNRTPLCETEISGSAELTIEEDDLQQDRSLSGTTFQVKFAEGQNPLSKWAEIWDIDPLYSSAQLKDGRQISFIPSGDGKSIAYGAILSNYICNHNQNFDVSIPTSLNLTLKKGETVVSIDRVIQGLSSTEITYVTKVQNRTETKYNVYYTLAVNGVISKNPKRLISSNKAIKFAAMSLDFHGHRNLFVWRKIDPEGVIFSRYDYALRP